MSIDPFPSIEKVLKQKGFTHFEWVPLKAPLSFQFYQQWLDNGHHQDMTYLQDSAPIKEDPGLHFHPMASLIVLTEDYFPHRPSPKTFPLKSTKIAHYAKQEDYHFWLRERLQKTCTALSAAFPGENFIPFTDAVPLLERDHASQGGLGWVGKNTCLIDRKKGSLFFIGEILTTLPGGRTPDPVPDFCGTCTRCMEACPTGALNTPKVLEPKKCIAYWNIEAKTNPPEAIRGAMGDWLFGCDICQSVCPWNIKIHKHRDGFLPSPAVPREALLKELRWILTTSNKKLMKALGRTPLNRAGGRGLKRNALIVATNKGLVELIPEIVPFEKHEKIGEVARWALSALRDLSQEKNPK